MENISNGPFVNGQKKQVAPQSHVVSSCFTFSLQGCICYLSSIAVSTQNPISMPFKHLFLSQNAQTIEQPPYQVPLPQSIHIRHGVFLVVRGLVVIEANHDGHFKLKNIKGIRGPLSLLPPGTEPLQGQTASA